MLFRTRIRELRTVKGVKGVLRSTDHNNDQSSADNLFRIRSSSDQATHRLRSRSSKRHRHALGQIAKHSLTESVGRNLAKLH